MIDSEQYLTQTRLDCSHLGLDFIHICSSPPSRLRHTRTNPAAHTHPCVLTHRCSQHIQWCLLEISNSLCRKFPFIPRCGPPQVTVFIFYQGKEPVAGRDFFPQQMQVAGALRGRHALREGVCSSIRRASVLKKVRGT